MSGKRFRRKRRGQRFGQQLRPTPTRNCKQRIVLHQSRVHIVIAHQWKALPFACCYKEHMCAKDAGLEIIQGRCRGTERLLIRAAKVTPSARLRVFLNARRKSWVQAISPGLALQIKITFSTRRKKEHNNGNYLLGRSGTLNAGGEAFFAEYLKQQSISMRRRPFAPSVNLDECKNCHKS